MPAANGKSILMKFKSIQKLIEHVNKLATFMGVNDTTEYKLNSMKISINNNFQEDIIELSCTKHIFAFHHFHKCLQTNFCSQFDISHIDPNQVDFVESLQLGLPNKFYHVKGDGNCFFRAISFAVTGDKNHHMVLREKIVNTLMEYEHLIESYLPSDMTCGEYVTTSNMLLNGTWATEIEILATTILLRTNIFTHNDRWLKYKCPMTTVEHGIYLQNLQNTHYDVVLRVHEKEENSSKYLEKKMLDDVQKVNKIIGINMKYNKKKNVV